MLKKTILLICLTTSFIYSGVINNLSVENIISSTNNAKDGKEKKKTYKELIAFLKGSASGEYSMYLGVIYLNGITQPDITGDTVKSDTKSAIKYFEKSINLEYFQSAAILGSLYLFDDRLINIKDSEKKSKFYLELAIKEGVYEATMALSSIYIYKEKDVKKGLELLMLGATHNISTTQLALATLYAQGSKDLDVKKDMFLANTYLEKACLNKKKTKKVKEFCSSKSVIGYTDSGGK